MTTIHVKTPAQLKQAYKKIAKGIESPLKSTRRMFMLLGTQIDRDTVLTFKRHGEKDGTYLDRRAWKWFAPSTMKKLKTYPNLGKIRYGTDLSGRPGMQGVFRGKGIRRYNSNSKLLQASGGFKQSFRIIRIGSKKMRYGSTHKLAGKIGSKPVRQVLHYTGQDQKRYGNLITRWWFKEMKI